MFAGGKGSVAKVATDLSFYLNSELSSVNSVLNFCINLTTIPHFFYLSSAAVYHESFEAAQEDHQINHDRLLPYAFLKSTMEQVLLRSIFASQGLLTILRVGTIYGPNMDKQILSDLIKQVKNKVNPVILKGSANQTRDYVHIEDLARFVEFTKDNAPLSTKESRNIINFGTGTSSSTSEFVTHALRAMKCNSNALFLGLEDFAHPKSLSLSCERLKKTGFKFKYDLSSGLANCFRVA